MSQLCLDMGKRLNNGKDKQPGQKERKLTDLELIALANEVKEQPCIWDLSNENHKKADAVDSAWTHVAEATGLTGNTVNLG
jgi:hypothetical protein